MNNRITPSWAWLRYLVLVPLTTLGVPTAVSAPVMAGTGPQSVTVDPSGGFAYVANQGSHDVSAFSINATIGALTAVAGSPFAAGAVPSSVITTGTIQ